MLFELPPVAEAGRAALAAAGLAGRSRVETGDFFEAVPAGGDLYRNALGRKPNEDEFPDVNYWASVMRIAGRGNAVLDFSEAEEHREKIEETSNSFYSGKFYYNMDSVDVLRAYQPVDKMPPPHGRHSMERRKGALRPNILWR